jgi:arylsulfatase A-like enzyme
MQARAYFGGEELKNLALVLGFLLCGPLCLAQDRPNILLLVAEDLSPRIGSYGDTVANTPNLDELALESVRYTNVFTTAGVCAPSRAALITGMHQISIGAQHMRSTNMGYYAVPPPEVKAFPEFLRAAGYYTFTSDKLDYQFSLVGPNSGPFTIWDAEGADADWSSRDPGQPFFGMYHYVETHESGVMRPTGPAYSDSHRQAQATRARRDVIAESVTSPGDVLLPPYYPDIPEVRTDLARHYDNIHSMDTRVGNLLARLEADGLADETIVIWTTDHGDGLPRAKRELYDSGIHVPMLVHIPPRYAPADWEPGSMDSRLVSFVDLAPTILEWAGITIPEYLHGHNFLGSMRSYIYASRDRIDDVPDRERAVRDSGFKYIRSWHPDLAAGHELDYRDNIDMVRAMREQYLGGQLTEVQRQWFQPTGSERLYDLSADPHEVVNLVSNPDFATVLDRLRDEMDRWLSEIGDWSDEPEDEMRERFLGSDEELRQTPSPRIDRRNGFVYISSADGASVGYRIDEGPWRLYVAPLTVSEGAIEAKAVRYGWRESPIARLE